MEGLKGYTEKGQGQCHPWSTKVICRFYAQIAGKCTVNLMMTVKLQLLSSYIEELTN